MDIGDEGASALWGVTSGKSNRDRILKTYEESKPLFVVMSGNAEELVRQRDWESQTKDIHCAVHADGIDITTNSAQAGAQLKTRSMNDSGDLGRGIQEEQQCHAKELDRVWEARDDVNDCRLDPIKARAARQAEMDCFNKMKVYPKVPV